MLGLISIGFCCKSAFHLQCAWISWIVFLVLVVFNRGLYFLGLLFGFQNCSAAGVFSGNGFGKLEPFDVLCSKKIHSFLGESLNILCICNHMNSNFFKH